MGPLHPMGQLECPYNMAAGAPRQVVQESQEEVSVPPGSPMSLHRLAPLRLGGMARAVTAKGQNHWSRREAADHTHYGWKSTSFSPGSHPWGMGAGEAFEIRWYWWHGASFRAMGCSHHPVPERPRSSPAADALWMNAPQLTDQLMWGATWTTRWPVSATVAPRCWGDLLSHWPSPFLHIPSALGFVQFLFFTHLVGVKLIS